MHNILIISDRVSDQSRIMLHTNQPTKKTITVDEQPVKVFPLANHPGISVQISKTVATIQKAWDNAAPSDNLFLRSSYLGMLEKFPPAKMGFRYIIFYKGNNPIGISYHQIFRLNVEESLHQAEAVEESNHYCIVKAISNAVKSWFIKRADFNLLISGNLLLTGSYGYQFTKDYNSTTSATLMQAGLDFLQGRLDGSPDKVSIQLIKDHLKSSSSPIEKVLKNKAYHPFLMQPCMKVDIRPEWTDFDAYLSDMSSKYRVRVKRARKKGASIVKKELTLEEIEANEGAIHSLYKEIADGAGFNAFLLHKKYFIELKRTLGNNYKLTGYYINDELVAFYTAIFNHGEMDAHFLGVDGKCNREHQIYLNILYDLVNMAIEHGCTPLDMARTALEIKSSVGAEAHDMVCFIKHRNSISSKFINLVFDSLNPKEEWKPRSPFKAKKKELI